MEKIKFSKNNINKKDIREVEKILKSGWLTHGKYSNYFEKEFSRFTGSKYSSLVSNCTAGLHLACQAMGFQKNDEVIARTLFSWLFVLMFFTIVIFVSKYGAVLSRSAISICFISGFLIEIILRF